ncbi:MAG: 50S ribosomal protein L9 [Gammaproteobacteria bacterium]|nr:50S ribosomal protein L9 [Gammaproteobacteria bacterium]|tara:strand:+ start:499 stop:948 length:450 start_codon:yes stop_codon:yes gene_type:complete
MKVILLESVENLGGIGDLVKVKAGYGRNFLLPQGKAALATDINIKEIESRRVELEKVAAEEVLKAKARAKSMNGTELIIPANVSSENKLFGSVGPIDIAKALSDIQIEVERSEIRMPDGPIQELGEYQVGIHLHGEVNAEVLIRVVAAE